MSTTTRGVGPPATSLVPSRFTAPASPSFHHPPGHVIPFSSTLSLSSLLSVPIPIVVPPVDRHVPCYMRPPQFRRPRVVGFGGVGGDDLFGRSPCSPRPAYLLTFLPFLLSVHPFSVFTALPILPFLCLCTAARSFDTRANCRARTRTLWIVGMQMGRREQGVLAAFREGVSATGGAAPTHQMCVALFSPFILLLPSLSLASP
ncbi:hypothetical protein C8J57DRAFT_1521219 [Mycena rebaudengoi]|nr:hypothetical protein C8J57DRAFT_1521219 [Mycena rebaudengoi]